MDHQVVILRGYKKILCIRDAKIFFHKRDIKVMRRSHQALKTLPSFAHMSPQRSSLTPSTMHVISAFTSFADDDGPQGPKGMM